MNKRLLHFTFLLTLIIAILFASAQEETKPEVVKKKKKVQLVNYTELGFSILTVTNPLTNVAKLYSYATATATLDFLFSPKLAAGIGTGFDTRPNEVDIPVFADIHYFLKEQKTAPFIVLQTGYYFLFTKAYNQIIDSTGVASYIDKRTFKTNAFFLNPQIGIRFPLRKSFCMTLDAGYKLIVKVDGVPNGYARSQSGGSLKIGFEFK